MYCCTYSPPCLSDSTGGCFCSTHSHRIHFRPPLGADLGLHWCKTLTFLKHSPPHLFADLLCTMWHGGYVPNTIVKGGKRRGGRRGLYLERHKKKYKSEHDLAPGRDKVKQIALRAICLPGTQLGNSQGPPRANTCLTGLIPRVGTWQSEL